MKHFLLLLFISLCTATLSAQQKESNDTQPDSTKAFILADASCGQCKLGLPGKGCNLAVRINGQAYFVDGSGIDSHGDAHAEDGFCNKIRKANVQGQVVNNRFKATYIKVLPDRAKKE